MSGRGFSSNGHGSGGRVRSQWLLLRQLLFLLSTMVSALGPAETSAVAAAASARLRGQPAATAGRVTSSRQRTRDYPALDVQDGQRNPRCQHSAWGDVNLDDGCPRGGGSSSSQGSIAGSSQRQLLRRAAPHHDALATLGVHTEIQLYVKPPAVVAGGRTLLLTVWLRRTGGGQAGAYPLPHQVGVVGAGRRKRVPSRDAVGVRRADQSLRGPAAHAAMAIALVNASSWLPDLRLHVLLAEPEEEGGAYGGGVRAGAGGAGVVVSGVDQQQQQQQPVVQFKVNTEFIRHGGFRGNIRPLSIHAELPPGSGTNRCFKILEASVPLYAVDFCLEPSPGLCAMLAPPGRYSDVRPALWTAIGPVREARAAVALGAGGGGAARDYGALAARIHHYMSHHLMVGVAGLLLYADEPTRHFVAASSVLAPYTVSGTLRLVKWDLPQRFNAEGRSAPYNGYNWDQAIFASHALLGLSACGANLALLITDLDEYILCPQPPPAAGRGDDGVSLPPSTRGSRQWADAASSCLIPPPPVPAAADTKSITPAAATAAAVSDFTSMWAVRRFDVVSTSVPVGQQPALWERLDSTGGSSEDGDTSNNVDAGSGARDGAALTQRRAVMHPLRRYDLVMRKPLPSVHSKQIMLPAAEVVAFFVREGWPLHGVTRAADPSCVRLLHVCNYFGVRRRNFNASDYRPIE